MAFVTKDWKDDPDTTTPLSAAAMEDLETRLAAYSDLIGPSYVTSLPGSPSDGQMIAYGADPTNGLIWLLRYRSGGGTYKWEFIGGPSWQSLVDTTENVAAHATNFVDLATVGPSITLPLAGEYLIAWGAYMGIGSSASSGTYSVPKIGAAAAVGSDATGPFIAAASSQFFGSGGREYRQTIASASTTIKLVYRADASTGTAGKRWLSITPIRVG